jgi:hypothetical protein
MTTNLLVQWKMSRSIKYSRATANQDTEMTIIDGCALDIAFGWDGKESAELMVFRVLRYVYLLATCGK